MVLLALVGSTIFFAGSTFAADSATNTIIELFKISAMPLKLRVHTNEVFKVALNIQNATSMNQTIYVWSCSWYWNWKVSNSSIRIPGWTCYENWPTKVEIKPGNSYVQELGLVIRNPAPKGIIKFRMGLTSCDPKTEDNISNLKMLSSQTYWSNEVTIDLISN